MKKVLVYGSLREGMYNYKAFKRAYPDMKKIKTTTIKGWDLFSLYGGAYPAIFLSKDKEKELTVDLFEVPDEAYNGIYRMEIGAGYHEENITLEDGTTAPIYVYNSNFDLKKNNIVEHGDWVKFKTEASVEEVSSN